MAATAKKIISAQALLNTSSKGQLGRNWSSEIWEITGDGSDTDVVLSSEIRVPHQLSICSATAATAPPTGVRSNLLPTANGSLYDLTVTFTAAPGNGALVRVKVEGIL